MTITMEDCRRYICPVCKSNQGTLTSEDPIEIKDEITIDCIHDEDSGGCGKRFRMVYTLSRVALVCPHCEEEI